MTRIQRILVPIDFSTASRAALEQAIMLAEAFDARIDALHVWEPAPAVTPAQLGWMAADAGTFCARVEKELQERVEALVAEVAPKSRDRIHIIVEAGYVAHTILEKLGETAYDLVVMGTHGRRGFKHLVLGSVAERLVRSAPCPVLTTRAPAEAGKTTSDDDEAIHEPPLETPTHL
jgi:nucleotide-binding universal stress UspA family protein